jgi:hypothetical protein
MRRRLDERSDKNTAASRAGPVIGTRPDGHCAAGGRGGQTAADRDVRFRGPRHFFCFDAQQAAEKAIKAVFMAQGLAFPYIHDLGRLLTVLAQARTVRIATGVLRWATRRVERPCP